MCIYMRERRSVVPVYMCNSSNSMSFLDITDPAKRTALIDEYVKAMKTVRQRNMVTREMMLAIGEELQTLQLSVRLSRLLRRQQKSRCL